MTSNGPGLSSQAKRELLKQLARGKLEAETTHPLSYGQRALWSLQHLLPDSPVYCGPLGFKILSDFDETALRKAFQWIVDSHAALRTTYSIRDGEPVQVVHAWQEIPFTVHDGRNWSDAQFQEEFNREAWRPFDLANDTMLRVSLYRRGPGNNVLLIGLHHIAMDLWSIALLVDDIRRFYPIARAGGRRPQKAAGAEYVDFVRWQKETIDGPDGERLRQFWDREFSGDLEPVELPTDFPRKPHPSFTGAALPFELDSATTGKLRTVARDARATMYSALVAGLQALLSRYSGRCEFLTRSLASGRSRSEFASVVGFFANPVVLRADLRGKPSFFDTVVRAQRTVANVMEHEDFPMSLMIERMKPDDNVGHHPLSEVMFLLQSPQLFRTQRASQALSSPLGVFTPGESGGRLDFGELVIEGYGAVRTITQSDLDIQLMETGDRISGAIHYRTELFKEETVARFGAHYRQLLEQAAENPAQPVWSIKYIPDDEMTRILVEFNKAGGPDLPAEAIDTVSQTEAEAGRCAYVLDTEMQPVAIGIAGELYTAAPVPDGPGMPGDCMGWRSGRTLKPTGYMARWTAHGRLEDLGTVDQQVWIRGIRVRTDDVCTVLKRHPCVADCAVAGWQGRHKLVRLIAYIVPLGRRPDVAELRTYLAAHLPEYMAPSFLLFKEKLPDGPDGKPDCRALLNDPDLNTQLERDYFTPRTPTQEKLMGVWSEVFGHGLIGVHDNFFALGGHSLQAVDLSMRISKEFDMELPLRALLESPTIIELADRIDHAAKSGSSRVAGDDGIGIKLVVPMRERGDGVPVVCVHPAGGRVHVYRQLVDAMPGIGPVFAVQSRGLATPADEFRHLSEAADYYATEIRNTIGDRPCHLLGWSSGGIFALSIAETMQRLGRSVKSVILIDSFLQGDTENTYPEFEAGLRLVLKMPGPFGDLWSGAMARLGQRVARDWAMDLYRRVIQLPIDQRASHLVEALKSRVFGLVPIPTDVLERQMDLLVLHESWLREFEICGFSGEVTAFWAADNAGYPRTDWEKVMDGPIHSQTVPGDHFGMLTPPAVSELADRLGEVLVGKQS